MIVQTKNGIMLHGEIAKDPVLRDVGQKQVLKFDLKASRTQDETGKWQSFYYITCPILFPVILFTLILSIMNAFKCYREAFLLGGTHPDNSIYFLQHFMNNNLQNLNYQKVSASATIITVFILFLSGLIYMIYYFLKRRTADA